MITLTRPQRKAVLKLWVRGCLEQRGISYRAFRKTVQGGSGCVMVQWCNMWIGIEPDGYTHS